MRHLLSIVFLICAVLSASATTLTATIDSRTSASLTCDPADALPSEASVQYSNTGNKGQITSGDVAVLTLSGLPKGTIQRVTLYMHSNTKSGAATISLTMGAQSWQVASGAFKDWPGISEYTTTDQPLSCLQQPLQIASNTSLQISITGTANSVYLQQLVVDYTEAPKVPHIVTLHWFEPSAGWQSNQLQEKSVSSGVQLPSLQGQNQMFDYEGDTWNWVGWSEQTIEATSSEPAHWLAEQQYYPEEDCHLYALYTSGLTHLLQQDTSYLTNEYALVCVHAAGAFALQGTWTNSQLALTPVAVSQVPPNSYEWPLVSLPNACRYNLTFDGDSVSIWNIGTSSWIGHSEKNANKYYTKWAWKRAGSGSIFIHGTWQYVEIGQDEYHDAYYAGMSLSYEPNDLSNPYIVFRKDAYSPDMVYWLLFPTRDVPEHVHVSYTTFPEQSAIADTPSPACLPSKVLDTNGTIRIVINNRIYNLFGNPL